MQSLAVRAGEEVFCAKCQAIIQSIGRIETLAWMDVWNELYEYELPLLCVGCVPEELQKNFPKDCKGVFILGYLPSATEAKDICDAAKHEVTVLPKGQHDVYPIPTRNDVDSWWMKTSFAFCYPSCVPIDFLCHFGDRLLRFKPAWSTKQNKFFKPEFDLSWQRVNQGEIVSDPAAPWDHIIEDPNALPQSDEAKSNRWMSWINGFMRGSDSETSCRTVRVSPRTGLKVAKTKQNQQTVSTYPFLANVSPVVLQSSRQVTAIWKETFKWNTIRLSPGDAGPFLMPATGHMGTHDDVMQIIQETGIAQHVPRNKRNKKSKKKKTRPSARPYVARSAEGVKARASAILAGLCKRNLKSYNIWSGFAMSLFEAHSPTCYANNITQEQHPQFPDHPTDCTCAKRTLMAQLPFFQVLACVDSCTVTGHTVTSRGPMLAFAASISRPISVQQVQKTMAYAHFMIEYGVYTAFDNNGPAASMDNFNLVLLLYKARRKQNPKISFGEIVDRTLASEEQYLTQWQQMNFEAKLEPSSPPDALDLEEDNVWEAQDFTKDELSCQSVMPRACDKCNALSYLGHIRFPHRKEKDNIICFRCHLLFKGSFPDKLPPLYSFHA